MTHLLVRNLNTRSGVPSPHIQIARVGKPGASRRVALGVPFANSRGVLERESSSGDARLRE